MIPTRKQELEAKIAAGELVKPRLLRSSKTLTTAMSKLSPQQLELVRHDLVDWCDPQTEAQTIPTRLSA
jgi:cytoplasmic iron level regulating protein YaaA (DUF328/UPF0246 family)